MKKFVLILLTQPRRNPEKFARCSSSRGVGRHTAQVLDDTLDFVPNKFNLAWPGSHKVVLIHGGVGKSYLHNLGVVTVDHVMEFQVVSGRGERPQAERSC